LESAVIFGQLCGLESICPDEVGRVALSKVAAFEELQEDRDNANIITAIKTMEMVLRLNLLILIELITVQQLINVVENI
jgi:hypothetical protein